LSPQKKKIGLFMRTYQDSHKAEFVLLLWPCALELELKMNTRESDREREKERKTTRR